MRMRDWTFSLIAPDSGLTVNFAAGLASARALASFLRAFAVAPGLGVGDL
jgi:hypothetical protein